MKRYHIILLDRNGFFAVTTALILSLLVLMVSVSLSVRSFYARSDSLDFESKARSISLARTCIEEGVIRYRLSSSTYTGDETVSVDSETCDILTITSSGTQRVIPAEAVVNDVYTYAEALYDPNTNEIVIIHEILQ